MYNIGNEVCLESSDNVVTMFCLLSNEPIPTPQFEITVVAVNVRDSHSESLYVIGGNSSSLNSTILDRIFEDSLVINVICQVSNSVGNDSETTLVRACGRLSIPYLFELLLLL